VPSLRPQTLTEFVGQDALRPVIQNAIDKANNRGKLVGPVILLGGPGLGKTTLAGIIARATGTKLLSYTGNKEMNAAYINRELLNIDVRGYGPGGVWSPGAQKFSLFVDEIHRMDKHSFESWYEPTESLEVHTDGRVFWLPDIQFLFATTDPNLPKPFMDRIPMKLHLEPYTVDDLCRIIRRLHPAMKLNIIRAIAERSCGVARLAINYSAEVDDYPGGLAWFDVMRIDRDGLGAWHKKYLDILENADKPLSLSVMASVLRENVQTVRMLEEELLRQQKITIGPAGRSLVGTAQARGPKL
jgi:Holliday junction DNA helicase RuvB